MSTQQNVMLKLAEVVVREVSKDKDLTCQEVDEEVESDDEEDESQILESLRNLGPVQTNATILLFMNFNCNELMCLWDLSTEVMVEEWGGRGRQAKIGPFNAFYLLPYSYKQGKEPDAIAKEFQPLWTPVDLSCHCVCAHFPIFANSIN
jgi:hypothetical protein